MYATVPNSPFSSTTPSAIFTLIWYVAASVPSADVNKIVTTFSPTWKSLLPIISTVASAWFGVAVISKLSTYVFKDNSYVYVSGLKAPSKLTLSIFNSANFKVLSVTIPSPFVTVIK